MTQAVGERKSARRWDDLALLGVAAAVALLHLLTNGRYGFHRDELQFLSDARHLDWGFVAYPPVTPLLERIGLAIFGVSLEGLRLFSVIAQAAAIVVTGLMAREFGGGRMAQVAAAVTVALSPLPLFEGTEFQYSSFDYLWWVSIAWCVVRMLRRDDPRWWVAIGAFVGCGLQTKYSIVFYIAGILLGALLTPARRSLRSGYFWGGVALALAIFLPNFLWQARHGFISFHFLQHIHARDVGEGRADGFLRDQFAICTNLASAPLWLAGLIWLLRERRYRMVGLMYLVPLALFFFGKGRGYYVAPAYPMLMAAGAAWGERWLGSLGRAWRLTIESAYFVVVATVGLYFIAVIVPVASSGPLKQFALERNGDLREEIGWPEMVGTVAGIRDALPPEQQGVVGILTGNYGEQGAIEMLGPAYRLPLPIGGTNSAWLRGYPEPPPTTLIVLGRSAAFVDRTFNSCRVAGQVVIPDGVRNEEGQYHRDIFVCAGPKQPWPEFWKDFQSYG